MGCFQLCIQIHLGKEGKADTRRKVINLLRQRVLEGPFRETTETNDRDPDREVFIGPIE